MSTRRKTLLHPAIVSIGCNCRRRSKVARLPAEKAKPRPPTTTQKPQPSSAPSPSSSSLSKFFSRDVSTLSSSKTSPKVSSNVPIPDGSIPPSLAGSVAVVKASQDPYIDFRDSMVQMILENDIYRRDDLRELLQCLLSLNSPLHHDAILRAFAEIVDGSSP